MMNPAFAQMHGYSIEELTGEPVIDIFAPDCRAEVAEQIRIADEKNSHSFDTKVEALRIPSAKGDISITLSIGVVEIDHASSEETLENIFRRADKAMYQAKQSGRNRTVVFGT